MKRMPVMAATALALLPSLLVLTLGAQTVAADWPQYLGPQRDGVYRGPALADTWVSSGPKVVWTKPVGQGFSGPVVADGRLILFHRVGDREVVQSLDARTGAEQWSYGYPTSYRDDFGFDEGPRAVPVVANGVVYTFGAEGQLHAVALTTDAALERRHCATLQGCQRIFRSGWIAARRGRQGDRECRRAGAGVVAFDAKTGKVLWTATDDEASYSSGVGATIAGKRYAIFLTRAGLVGLDPATGAVQFQKRWRARQNASVNAATPIVQGDLIFISARGTDRARLRCNSGGPR